LRSAIQGHIVKILLLDSRENRNPPGSNQARPYDKEIQCVKRKPPPVPLRILVYGDPDLLQIVAALRLPCRLPCCLNRRQQESDQKADDENDDQQLN
jgi:hypothetical protein